MKIKNVSARGWTVFGKMIAPGTVEEVDCTEADIAGNDDLEIVKDEEESGKRGRPAKSDK